MRLKSFKLIFDEKNYTMGYSKPIATEIVANCINRIHRWELL